MKKLIALLLTFIMLFTLSACGIGNGGETGITPPDGMQLAEVGDGYTFFAPEDWCVDLSTGIATAYVSTVDPSYITLVQLDDRDPATYFAEAEARLADMLTDYTLHEAEDNALMGGKAAIVRVYSGKLMGIPYRYKQYLCSYGGYLYLMTYTAKEEIPSGDVSYFARYEETADAVAAAFLFSGTAADAEKPTEEPITNENGLVLISDPAITGYSLYVPSTWTPDLQNGTTSAMRDGHAAITVIREIPNENTIEDYWAAKEEAYRSLYEDFILLESECSLPAATEEDVTVWLDGHQAARYVYTYTKNGITYKVNKLLTLDGLYVLSFTYTARLTPVTGGEVPYQEFWLDYLNMKEDFRFN